MSQLEIYRTLVLSTGHVSAETARILNNDKPRKDGLGKCQIDGHVADWGEYGWVVYCGGNTVPQVDNDTELMLLPEDLHRCLMFARDHDCQFVRFDCDGPLVDGLPEFDW